MTYLDIYIHDIPTAVCGPYMGHILLLSFSILADMIHIWNIRVFSRGLAPPRRDEGLTVSIFVFCIIKNNKKNCLSSVLCSSNRMEQNSTA